IGEHEPSVGRARMQNTRPEWLSSTGAAGPSLPSTKLPCQSSPLILQGYGMGALANLALANGQRAAVLGVERSVRGLKWRERIDPADLNLAAAISQHHDLPELLGRVLAARGVGLDEVPTVLDPTIKALMPDPSVLQDMDKAAVRLADAIVARERIALFGDYDVDG